MNREVGTGRLKAAHRHARRIVWTRSMSVFPHPIKLPIIFTRLIAFGYFALRAAVEWGSGKGVRARGKGPCGGAGASPRDASASASASRGRRGHAAENPLWRSALRSRHCPQQHVPEGAPGALHSYYSGRDPVAGFSRPRAACPLWPRRLAALR